MNQQQQQCSPAFLKAHKTAWKHAACSGVSRDNLEPFAELYSHPKSTWGLEPTKDEQELENVQRWVSEVTEMLRSKSWGDTEKKQLLSGDKGGSGEARAGKWPARSRADKTRGSFLSIKMEHGMRLEGKDRDLNQIQKEPRLGGPQGSGINYQQASETSFTRELRKYSNDYCHEVCTRCP